MKVCLASARCKGSNPPEALHVAHSEIQTHNLRRLRLIRHMQATGTLPCTVRGPAASAGRATTRSQAGVALTRAR